ncbi:MOSC domain-containing protein [Sphingomonas sp.]|uniref:MOSC domain-containing protein n=1 Tax=Sphingomonas sp. TaxID=28214 RepID=UPI003CC55C74
MDASIPDAAVLGTACRPPAAAGPGTLAGIARKAHHRAPMELLEQGALTVDLGLVGDFRGVRKPTGRNRRQVTLFARADWTAACGELRIDPPWWRRRCNLMVDGLGLPQRPGAIIRVGGALLEVTVECDPCVRMDEVAPGLFAALVPDWRGGVCTRVLTGGAIALGDEIEVVG